MTLYVNLFMDSPLFHWFYFHHFALLLLLNNCHSFKIHLSISQRKYLNVVVVLQDCLGYFWSLKFSYTSTPTCSQVHMGIHTHTGIPTVIQIGVQLNLQINWARIDIFIILNIFQTHKHSSIFINIIQCYTLRRSYTFSCNLKFVMLCVVFCAQSLSFV